MRCSWLIRYVIEMSSLIIFNCLIWVFSLLILSAVLQILINFSFHAHLSWVHMSSRSNFLILNANLTNHCCARVVLITNVGSCLIITWLFSAWNCPSSALLSRLARHSPTIFSFLIHSSASISLIFAVTIWILFRVFVCLIVFDTFVSGVSLFLNSWQILSGSGFRSVSLHKTWVTRWCSFIGGWCTSDITNVITSPSRIWRMMNFWLIAIYLSQSNNVPSAFGLNFIRWSQWIRISSSFKLDHIWGCNILTVCNIIRNVGNSILLQLVGTGLFNVTYFHVVASLNISVLGGLVCVHLRPLNIIHIKFIVRVATETFDFVIFALWID